MARSSRSLFAAAMLLAAVPPLLSVRLNHSPSTAEVVSNRIGLTLGEYAGRVVVVTSLRSRGPADRSGIRVGDMLDAVAARPVAGLAEAQRLIQTTAKCGMTLRFRHAGIPYDARIWQCGKPLNAKGRHIAARQEYGDDGPEDFAGRG